ncbi:phage tail protein I [Laribacter hongkongensis]|uniref:Bacteriophage P2-related tail formation protein n=1 Tax=Laribacter hongkongensis TaxID=168471 RepID=A0A248LHT8_9NEIS|nr:phage tail protein I [Laribacter hongkongensis]ASJ24318.1 bacteriophage P2-related tail formation protein [Laribacter hongkongensis]MCG9041999.1 phage tail protein I [Laribacter hongkongensis]MCG9068997.1 phage tail protein I [Laribacter hongkongensis]MCG9087721.1 phage tail protein I [Laribacter hongkongensis]MCG9110836.1 phage tail protein I [Laribacter hongkongensis]
MDSLLPSGSTPLEKAASTATSGLASLPVPLADLWDPARCPVKLLPYLAWALSVDRWDDAWPEATQRRAIRNAFFIHKHKGTIGAVRRAVEQLGYLIEVIEWWQTQPPGPRGTFRLNVGVLDSGISEAMYQELERLIADAKPLSRHLTGLAISLSCHGSLPVAAVSHDGDTLTVYPYTPATITTTGIPRAGAGIHLIDTLTLRENG